MASGYILVADDNRINRMTLARMLEVQGHAVMLVEDGEQAFDMATSVPVDLVLLDLVMPGLDGYEVLEKLRADSRTQFLPVIIVSAMDDMASIVRCIKMGADDYVLKPFDPVLLRARIDNILERKILRDREARYLAQLEAEKEKSERLLLNVLPPAIARKLKNGHQIIADVLPDVSVLFADIVDFTSLTANLSPADLVRLLNRIFSAFDNLAAEYELEKIKTIGDAYMVVGGVPTPHPDHLEAVADMALAMQNIISAFVVNDRPLQMRIGIHCGSVVAGVIGTHKFSYDLWGDTVNIASRMEEQGLPGEIQVTEQVYRRLSERYTFQQRGLLTVRGHGAIPTYLLTGHTVPHPVPA